MKVFIIAPVFSAEDNNVNLLQQKQSALWRKEIENYSSNSIIKIDPNHPNDYTRAALKIIIENNIDSIMTVLGWEEHIECVTLVRIARELGMTVYPEATLI